MKIPLPFRLPFLKISPNAITLFTNEIPSTWNVMTILSKPAGKNSVDNNTWTASRISKKINERFFKDDIEIW